LDILQVLFEGVRMGGDDKKGCAGRAAGSRAGTKALITTTEGVRKA